MEPKLCFIKETYFKKNASFVKLLDTEIQINSQKERIYAL